METVNIAVQESSEGLSNVTGSVAELTGNIESINTEAASNKAVAAQLEAEVNKFKL